MVDGGRAPLPRHERVALTVRGPRVRVAFLLLALFAEMERTFTAERAAQARAVAEANNRHVGRPIALRRPSAMLPPTGPRRAGNCHGPRGRIRVMLDSPGHKGAG